MKTLLCCICLFLSVTVLNAFNQRTFSAGGNLSFSRYDSDGMNHPITTILLQPQFGYFFVDNLSIDIQTDISIQRGRNSRDEKYKRMSSALGLGFRYFIERAYLGSLIIYDLYSYSTDDYDSSYSSSQIEFKGGYLYEINHVIYLDTMVSYRLGIGKYSGDYEGDNTQSLLRVGIGLSAFFR